MKDRLLYLTIGLLIGIVVMQWGVTSQTITIPTARAGYVDHTATGIIAMNEGRMLDQYGVMWNLQESGWREAAHSPVPVPVNDVKFFHSSRLITTANVGWLISAGGEWIEVGPWPGGLPVPTEQNSWGSMKQLMNEDGD